MFINIISKTAVTNPPGFLLAVAALLTPAFIFTTAQPLVAEPPNNLVAGYQLVFITHICEPL